MLREMLPVSGIIIALVAVVALVLLSNIIALFLNVILRIIIRVKGL